eukprot:CAMPEP_0179848316 /NCGR_PEP_ID=MMETSP0982-20121206/6555_1 /TAXON_ID=483367 /ORGANISM="non described non described, Strain CCMP 2436" /LENGTH=64 /DNA_ID=CAMNT_0021733567 /DNA_START=162 /DNA_END=356 /DNA_ORIENTATION=+
MAGANGYPIDLDVADAGLLLHAQAPIAVAGEDGHPIDLDATDALDAVAAAVSTLAAPALKNPPS